MELPSTAPKGKRVLPIKDIQIKYQRQMKFKGQIKCKHQIKSKHQVASPELCLHTKFHPKRL